jgi:hypothetical protein
LVRERKGFVRCQQIDRGLHFRRILATFQQADVFAVAVEIELS